MNSKSNFLKNYRRWAKDNEQYGNQAFSRYVILYFLDSLVAQTDDFVFKGGNLLWHYIKTPRKTVDLDLSTITSKNHEIVRREIEKVNQVENEDITFAIKEFKDIEKKEVIGSKIIIEYKTGLGQKNQFGLDIVYAIPSDIALIKSTLSGKKIKSASIENIIADKVSAAQSLRGGNTRMKDFDDLWRISKSDQNIDGQKLKRIFEERGIDFDMSKDWASYMKKNWQNHCQLYEDLPSDISEVFDEINNWLSKLSKE